MNPEKPAEKSRMSVDDILELLDGLAQDPEAGADRLRAAKILLAQNSATVVMPAPLTELETVDRLARVMKPCGQEICRLAFQKAHPWSPKPIDVPPPGLKDEILTDEDLAIVEKVRGLKSLYRHFPEIKGPGFPSGFPLAGSPEARLNWLRRKAKLIMVERHMKRAEQRAQEQAQVDNGSQGPTSP